MKMDESLLKTKIGTKETEKLKPGKVEVVAIDISPPIGPDGKVIQKGGKDLADKVTFSCKHPDGKELISISKAKYLKGEALKEAGIWFHKDEDGNIPKNSVLSSVLRHYGASDLSEMANKELDTISNEGGFLCIKAY